MTGLLQEAAIGQLVLVSVAFGLAGSAKISEGSSGLTNTALAILVRRYPAWVRKPVWPAIGIGELSLAIVLIVVGGRSVLIPTVLVTGAFALYLIWVIGAHPGEPCGCRRRLRAPTTKRDVAFTVCLGIAASIALAENAELSQLRGTGGSSIAVVAIVVLVEGAALTALRRSPEPIRDRFLVGSVLGRIRNRGHRADEVRRQVEISQKWQGLSANGTPPRFRDAWPFGDVWMLEYELDWSGRSFTLVATYTVDPARGPYLQLTMLDPNTRSGVYAFWEGEIGGSSARHDQSHLSSEVGAM